MPCIIIIYIIYVCVYTVYILYISHKCVLRIHTCASAPHKTVVPTAYRYTVLLYYIILCKYNKSANNTRARMQNKFNQRAPCFPPNFLDRACPILLNNYISYSIKYYHIHIVYYSKLCVYCLGCPAMSVYLLPTRSSICYRQYRYHQIYNTCDNNI